MWKSGKKNSGTRKGRCLPACVLFFPALLFPLAQCPVSSVQCPGHSKGGQTRTRIAPRPGHYSTPIEARRHDGPNPNPLPFRFLASSSYVCLVLAFSFCIHFLVGTRFCFIRYRGGGPTHAWSSIGGPTPALYQCLSCHVVSYAGKEKKKKYSDGKAKKYMEQGLENCFRPSVCERIKANSH